MERIHGIGGFFFRSKNPQKLSQWYEDTFGITSIEFNGPWSQEAGPTVFAPFPADTDYFGSKEQVYMLNFRVENLDLLLAQLREKGAKIDETIVTESVGRFAWVFDPEGNKIELWEPSAGYK